MSLGDSIGLVFEVLNHGSIAIVGLIVFIISSHCSMNPVANRVGRRWIDMEFHVIMLAMFSVG